MTGHATAKLLIPNVVVVLGTDSEGFVVSPFTSNCDTLILNLPDGKEKSQKYITDLQN